MKKKNKKAKKVKKTKRPVKKARKKAKKKRTIHRDLITQPAPKKLKATPRIAKSKWGQIRRMLVEKRNATLMAMKKIKGHDITTDVGDEADQAGQLVEKELQFELSDNERNQLDQIEGALRKMDKGTYGLCEQCVKPINALRIKALPFARYCIVCQNNSERAVF